MSARPSPPALSIPLRSLVALRRYTEKEILAVAAREDLPLNTDDLPVVEYGMGKPEQLFRAKL